MARPAPKKKPKKEKSRNNQMRLGMQLVCDLDRNDGCTLAELMERYNKGRNTVRG